MRADYSDKLNPQKALIWRIVHRHNLPWILEHGLCAVNHTQPSSNWVSIGHPELIDKRARHPVLVGPGGVLNDYVPFYFTPFSPMLKNIHSGWGGIVQRPNDDILILVSSLYELQKRAVPFVFTDSHAYCQVAEFYTELGDLERIDWSILQRRDFSRDLNDPRKMERYQAEALVHGRCPVEALLGVICHSQAVKSHTQALISQHQLELPVYSRPEWYFR